MYTFSNMEPYCLRAHFRGAALQLLVSWLTDEI